MNPDRPFGFAADRDRARWAGAKGGKGNLGRKLSEEHKELIRVRALEVWAKRKQANEQAKQQEGDA